MDRLEEMMSSPTAWSPVYETVIKTDDTRVPEVGEYVLSLIAGITGTHTHTHTTYTSLFRTL